jgi:hypothetical protein
LIVTTESGQTTIEFFVVAPTVPSVTVITPGAGEPGQTVPVTLRGLNLPGATVSESTPDLTLQNPQPVDDETVTWRSSAEPLRRTPTLTAPKPGVSIDGRV